MNGIRYLIKKPFLTFIIDLIDSKYSQNAKPIRVLDVGCGGGEFCRLLKAHYKDKVELVGIDPGDDIVAAKEQPNGIEFVQDTFMGFADKVQTGSFDVVIFTKSLHHCEDLPKITVERARQLLCPNGLFVAEELWTHIFEEDEGSLRWIIDRVDLLNAAGVIQTENTKEDFLPALDSKLPLKERWDIALSGCRDHSSVACKEGILEVFGQDNTRIFENLTMLREWWPSLGLRDDATGLAIMAELMSQEERALTENQIKGIGIVFVSENI